MCAVTAVSAQYVLAHRDQIQADYGISGSPIVGTAFTVAFYGEIGLCVCWRGRSITEHDRFMHLYPDEGLNHSKDALASSAG